MPIASGAISAVAAIAPGPMDESTPAIKKNTTGNNNADFPGATSIHAGIAEAVNGRGVPFLGICVGMQALLDHSEENDGVDCIGLFPGNVRFFGKDLHEDGEHLKVPHMGWNEVSQANQHPLWHDIPDRARFYFVHSYYIDAGKPAQVVGRGHYGVDFAAALADGSRFAVQFHPEKSHTHGLQLLQNFAAWDGRW